LEINRKYPIFEAQSVVTKYGPTVLLSIKDKRYNTMKVLIHKRYSTFFFEADTNSINSQNI